MTKPCVMWSVGPRIHGGKEACGKLAWHGALAPPSSDIPYLPICNDCIKNLQWPKEMLRLLT
jgi:hypothetical protein